MNPMSHVPIDILVVTGPLGAGKTTLVNRLLRIEIAAARKVAVLINEFGSVSIDGALLEATRPDLAAMENLLDGCACCSLRSEVVDTLDAWASRPEATRPQRVVLETTGLADPTDLMDLDQEPLLAGRVRLAGCLTVVSALTPLHHLQQRDLVRRQVALASLIHVSKTDLDPAMAMAWSAQIQAAHISHTVVRTCQGLGPEGAPDPWQGELRASDGQPGLGYGAAHALTLRWDHPLDPEALETLLRQGLPGGELLRAKGVAAFQGWPAREDGSDRWAFHLADGRVEILPLPPLPDGSLPPCMGVVIGTGLDHEAWRRALRSLERPPAGARRKVLL